MTSSGPPRPEVPATARTARPSPARAQAGRRPGAGCGFAAAGAIILLLSSCSLVIDSSVAQCQSDRDCAGFGSGSAVVCDLAARICVRTSDGEPGPGRGQDADPGTATPSGQEGDAATGGGEEAAPGPADPRDAGAGDGDAVSADAAGDGAPLSPCQRPDRPLVRIEGEITASDTLPCDRLYLLVGPVFVKAGVVLTLMPGTTLLGDSATGGTLVVQPGARLVADGQRDAPIVFTSSKPPAERRPGDWGGLILLGRAPTNQRQPTIEGITAGGEYGGDRDDDDSGVLRFVRIEYSGTRLGPNNEINGLTLGGVGRGTVIDQVQVRQTTDDCFEFFGGTVNARHLVCQGNGDDGFDFDFGYRGKLQFLVLQQDPAVVDETNGVEVDNDGQGSSASPVTEPTIYNATLCGKNQDPEREQYGLLVRRGGRARVYNSVLVGFEAGYDLRDAAGPATLDLRNSLFWANLAAPIAYAEDGSNGSTQRDDDAGFNEVRFFQESERRNAVGAPGLAGCFDRTRLDLFPASALTRQARSPPADGFLDPAATYQGAFRDATDRWTDGAWLVWSER